MRNLQRYEYAKVRAVRNAIRGKLRYESTVHEQCFSSTSKKCLAWGKKKKKKKELRSAIRAELRKETTQNYATQNTRTALRNSTNCA